MDEVARYNRERWNELVRANVVFYDQLGCGGSDRPDDLSLWRTERFVEELDLLRKSRFVE